MKRKILFYYTHLYSIISSEVFMKTFTHSKTCLCRPTFYWISSALHQILKSLPIMPSLHKSYTLSTWLCCNSPYLLVIWYRMGYHKGETASSRHSNYLERQGSCLHEWGGREYFKATSKFIPVLLQSSVLSWYWAVSPQSLDKLMICPFLQKGSQAIWE